MSDKKDKSEKKKKQSTGMKIKKSMGSSVGTSKVGKALIKDVLGKNVRFVPPISHSLLGHPHA